MQLRVFLAQLSVFLIRLSRHTLELKVSVKAVSEQRPEVSRHELVEADRIVLWRCHCVRVEEG